MSTCWSSPPSSSLHSSESSTAAALGAGDQAPIPISPHGNVVLFRPRAGPHTKTLSKACLGERTCGRQHRRGGGKESTSWTNDQNQTDRPGAGKFRSGRESLYGSGAKELRQGHTATLASGGQREKEDVHNSDEIINISRVRPPLGSDAPRTPWVDPIRQLTA